MQFNRAKVEEYLTKFKFYIENRSNKPLNASNPLKSNPFFMSKDQEGYKEEVYEEARRGLDFNSWILENLGSGEIISKAKIAINKAGNLVYPYQKSHFKNQNNRDVLKAETLLYNIYRNDDFEKSFSEAMAFWGGKYDLIAYLFFVKDKNKYLPISPTNFDEKFARLDINLKMSFSCSPQNYHSFIECIDNLRKYMEEFFDFEFSLLDAHSVIWMMDSVEKYVAENVEDTQLVHDVNVAAATVGDVPSEQDEEPEDKADPKRVNGQKVYPRSRSKAVKAMVRAGFNCEIDPSHESFIRKNSHIKYLEPHHLIPMSQSERFKKSLDHTANIVCLCSNCHNEIHYGENAEKLIGKLFQDREERLKKAEIPTTLSKLLKMY